MVFFNFLCTFFAFFASADRKSRYIRYRDNIDYPRYGENYNIGDNQYSSKNLSYCPKTDSWNRSQALPVPACSGQPLPGVRRFSSPLRNRIFSERGVASIGVRSSGNLCVDEEYAKGEAGA